MGSGQRAEWWDAVVFAPGHHHGRLRELGHGAVRHKSAPPGLGGAAWRCCFDLSGSLNCYFFYSCMRPYLLVYRSKCPWKSHEFMLGPRRYWHLKQNMTMFNIVAPHKPAAQALSQDGLSLLIPTDLTAALALPEDWARNWGKLTSAWNNLPPDAHLKDGGSYRQRRHACFVQDISSYSLTQTPHRAHWQPTDYNALHGGFERWF